MNEDVKSCQEARMWVSNSLRTHFLLSRFRLALVILLATTDASAQNVFSPTQCAACPVMTEVPWTFSTNELPSDPNCSSPSCPRYINNLNYSFEVAANSFVTQLQVRVDSFNTEPDYDYFRFREAGNPSWSNSLSGTVATGTWLGPALTVNASNKDVELGFVSDSNYTAPGITLGKARVCCSTAPGYALPAAPLLAGKRMSGILQGTNDVVYYYANNGQNSPASPKAEIENIALWGVNPGSNDFDIYVRCNAVPTPSAYDASGRSGDTNEIIRISATACTYPGIWYIAVYSYRGVGQYNLTFSRELFRQSTPVVANAGSYPIRAGTNWNATSAELEQSKKHSNPCCSTLLRRDGRATRARAARPLQQQRRRL